MFPAGFVAVAGLARAFWASAFPVPAFTASPTRIDLLDPRGNRTGFASVRGDQVDFFTVRGDRRGSGRIRDHEAETFGRQGKRTGLCRSPWRGGVRYQDPRTGDCVANVPTGADMTVVAEGVGVDR